MDAHAPEFAGIIEMVPATVADTDWVETLALVLESKLGHELTKDVVRELLDVRRKSGRSTVRGAI